MADDLDLTVTGVGPSGQQRTPEEMKALQAATADAAAGAFTIVPLSVVSEGDRVVVEARGHLPLKDGSAHENEYSFHFDLQDGRISKLRTYCDTGYADRTFPGY